ncbi:uncharacterized protein zgc:113279 [Heterodontus francisci]|uniref:uncharacterized protein zgc:113279 n=1 Tax=Heterodontus francisci TaxID=7792 RepID=UPI00355BA978
MLYNVLSPDSQHDQSSNDSGIVDCFRGSTRSPLAGEVPATPGDCCQPSPSSHPPGITEVCKEKHNKTRTEAASDTLTGLKNHISTESQRKYLGVRVRQPVRDLLRNYRTARGKDPNDVQVDVTWKSNNLRRRVVREAVHGHPYNTEQSVQITKTNACPLKNCEELLEDLVEVLETDLKQGKMCSYQMAQSPTEMDCQMGCYPGCSVNFWDSHYGNQQLQTDQGALDWRSSCFSKDSETLPDLESASSEPCSHLESEFWNLSPVQLEIFADKHCWNISDKYRPFSFQPGYSQNVTEQSLPHSPSPGAEFFSQAALNNIQSSKSYHVESKCPPVAAQYQYYPDSSAFSFFQFQLQHAENSLSTLSPQDILSVDKNGNTMLHNAVIQGKRALAYSLACRMANMGRIDAKNTRGCTALHLAAERNQHLMLNDLISLGAQINDRDYLGKTPVHLCAENGFLRVLHVLEKALMNGTDVYIDAVDNNYLTPLHCAVLAHSAIVKEFENPDMDCDMKKFHTLRKEQLLDGIRCLLRMGSSLSMQDTNGQSAIHFAEEVNNTEVLHFLYGHVDEMETVHHKELSKRLSIGC